MSAIPLSLYIHFPWCIKKCPYCDFNSHALKDELPAKQYIERVLADLKEDLALIDDRPIKTIFMGGGTPSLFSPDLMKELLEKINEMTTIDSAAEITMEANPGAIEQIGFEGYLAAGINRLSLGVQSFQDEYLTTLGRIHDADTAIKSFELARQAGFKNINIDLMHGLPKQTMETAMLDLEKAIALKPEHLSWYQLTLEPNTEFYITPPTLPSEEILWDIIDAGTKKLNDAGYTRYEVSAFSQEDKQCQHNINYWQFGDYLGIGAGAHAKITNSDPFEITRYWKHKHPKAYLETETPFIQGKRLLTLDDMPLEFFMNAFRLFQTLPFTLINERTQLTETDVRMALEEAEFKKLVHFQDDCVALTEQGSRFLNNVLETLLQL